MNTFFFLTEPSFRCTGVSLDETTVVNKCKTSESEGSCRTSDRPLDVVLS